VLGRTGPDTGADGAVDSLRFAVPPVHDLLIFGVDERVLTVFAGFDLIWHKDILYSVE